MKKKTIVILIILIFVAIAIGAIIVKNSNKNNGVQDGMLFLLLFFCFVFAVSILYDRFIHLFLIVSHFNMDRCWIIF